MKVFKKNITNFWDFLNIVFFFNIVNCWSTYWVRMPDCLTYNPEAIISELHSDSGKGNLGEECNDFYRSKEVIP